MSETTNEAMHSELQLREEQRNLLALKKAVEAGEHSGESGQSLWDIAIQVQKKYECRPND